MLPELLALDFRNLELERAGLPAAVRRRQRTSAPGRAAVDLCQVGELAKAVGVAEGHEDDAVVGEGRDGVGNGGFLTSAGGRGAHEHARVLLGEGALAPEDTGLVPERLCICARSECADG